jgi:hypothetical protein
MIFNFEKMNSRATKRKCEIESPERPQCLSDVLDERTEDQAYQQPPCFVTTSTRVDTPVKSKFDTPVKSQQLLFDSAVSAQEVFEAEREHRNAYAKCDCDFLTIPFDQLSM